MSMSESSAKSRIIKHSGRYLSAAGVTRILTITNLPEGGKISVDGNASNGTSNSVTISNGFHVVRTLTSPAKSITIPASTENVTLDFNSPRWNVDPASGTTTIEVIGDDGGAVTPSHSDRFTHTDRVDTGESHHPYNTKISYRLNYNTPAPPDSPPKYTVLFSGNSERPADYDYTFVLYEKNVIPSVDIPIIVYNASGDVLPGASGIANVQSGEILNIVSSDGAAPNSTPGFANRLVVLPRPSPIPSGSSDGDIRRLLKRYFGSSSERIQANDLHSAYNSIIALSSSSTSDRSWWEALATIIERVNSSPTNDLHTLFGAQETHSGTDHNDTTHEDHPQQTGTVIIRGVGANGSVSLTPQSGRRHDSSGWRFDDVSPGSYVVSITWNNGITEHHDLRVEAGRIEDVDYGNSSKKKNNESYLTPAIGVVAGIAILGGVEWLRGKSQA